MDFSSMELLYMNSGITDQNCVMYLYYKCYILFYFMYVLYVLCIFL